MPNAVMGRPIINKDIYNGVVSLYIESHAEAIPN